MLDDSKNQWEKPKWNCAKQNELIELRFWLDVLDCKHLQEPIPLRADYKTVDLDFVAISHFRCPTCSNQLSASARGMQLLFPVIGTIEDSGTTLLSRQPWGKLSQSRTAFSKPKAYEV
jgi:hypothetical protein